MGMELREMSPRAHPTRRKPQTSAGALVPQDPNGRDAFPFWKESKGRFGKPIQYEGGWQAHLDRPELPMPGVWDGPRPPLSEEGQRTGGGPGHGHQQGAAATVRAAAPERPSQRPISPCSHRLELGQTEGSKMRKEKEIYLKPETSRQETRPLVSACAEELSASGFCNAHSVRGGASGARN